MAAHNSWAVNGFGRKATRGQGRLDRSTWEKPLVITHLQSGLRAQSRRANSSPLISGERE